jgi:hypothetical protein
MACIWDLWYIGWNECWEIIRWGVYHCDDVKGILSHDDYKDRMMLVILAKMVGWCEL